VTAGPRAGDGGGTEAQVLLEARNLHKAYPGARNAFGAAGDPVTAVAGVSFRLAGGDEPLAVVGESGSGKSTLARLLAGLELPDRGKVLVRGATRTRRRRRDRLAAARDVQLVFQDPYLSLDPRIPVGRCLEEVLALHFDRPRTWRRQRAAELLGAVGLRQEMAADLPRRLSGGERQRVAIARALAAEPSLLVLDEAVSSLDVSTQWRILRLLASLRERLGLSYVFVTHDLGVAKYLTGRVLVMHRGAVVEDGPTHSVLTTPQSPYTQLLVDSIPRPGWQPGLVLERHAAVTEAMTKVAP
jgi:oligopeptide transport system ATP-binding protein